VKPKVDKREKESKFPIGIRQLRRFGKLSERYNKEESCNYIQERLAV